MPFNNHSTVKVMNNDKISTEIAELRLQRNALRDRLEAIEKDYKSGLSADSEEQAIQLENADVLEGIAKVTAEELSQVEARLAELKKSLAG
jgi:anaerobic ribonucleoside-triphosphate reductase